MYIYTHYIFIYTHYIYIYIYPPFPADGRGSAARKTGAEARTAKFEPGTWARENARAWASKKRKKHEEGSPISKVSCRFRKKEAQEPRTGKFEASFLSVQKVTLGIVRHWPLPVGDRFRHAVAW